MIAEDKIDFNMDEKKFTALHVLLFDRGYLLMTQYTPVGTEKEVTMEIKEYKNYEELVKIKIPARLYLMNKKSGEQFDVATINSEEQEGEDKAGGAGQWIWKKVCEAAEAGGIMKDCNKFFNWK